MKIIYALLFFAGFGNVYAQPALTWAKQMGGSSTNSGHSVAVDDSGNVYTRGSFWSTTDFDPGPGVFNLTPPGGQGGSFICKLNAAGNFVWAVQFGGPVANDRGYGIALDNKGFVYTTGYFTGTADFDPGSGVYNMTSAGFNDIFVIKLTAGGSLVWVKQMGGSAQDNGFGIAVGQKGDVYTTGWFSGTADFDPGAGTYNLTSLTGGADIFVSKLNASGNFVWAKQMGGNSTDEASAIALDGKDNVYTTGYFFYTSDFDPGAGVHNMTTAGSANVFISKLDSAGKFVWAKQLGGTSDSYGLSIKADNAGNVYTTGYFDGTADFNPGAGTYNLTSSGLDDIFISKLDTSGNFVWAKQIGGAGYDRGQSIVLDGLGNVYTTGYFQNTADFDPGAGTDSMTSAGSMDVFISELDTAGNFVCAGRMGGGSSTGDIAWGIAADKNGYVYATGQFAGTADFDPGIGTSDLTATGVIDIFTSKYQSCNFIIPPPPTALFQANDTVFCSNACANFTDQSLNATSWLWSFTGGTPATSADESPQKICYYTPGNYDVKLIAYNAGGNDTLNLKNYITVNPVPPSPVIKQTGGTTLYFHPDSTYSSYQWFDSTTLIQNATDTFIVISHSGQYNVEAKNKYGCKIGGGTIVTITGMADYQRENMFSLSPNPATNKLMVIGYSLMGKGELKIYTILGKVALSYSLSFGEGRGEAIGII